MHKFIVVFILSLWTSATFCAEGRSTFETKGMYLQKEKLAFYTPIIFNPKYFSFEFGFLTTKKIGKSYPFNAFAEAFVTEESFTTNDQLRAGALGFKGGVFMPTQPWIPIFLQFSFGFAKTTLHHEPWFGKREQSTTTKDMFLVEAGAMIRWNNFLFRYLYQLNTLDYFTKKSFLSIGANF